MLRAVTLGRYVLHFTDERNSSEWFKDRTKATDYQVTKPALPLKPTFLIPMLNTAVNDFSNPDSRKQLKKKHA